MRIAALLLGVAVLVGTLPAAANFCPGTGAELRWSENYVIQDTMGQFVTGKSSLCPDDADPMLCSYSCSMIEHGVWHSALDLPSIARAKQSSDYTQVRLYASVVTAGNDRLYRMFYVEDMNRSAAIKVNVGSNPNILVSEGDLVDVCGVIKTTNRERYVDFPEVIVRFPNAFRVMPYFIGNRYIGGEVVDTLGYGADNISLLVRTCGRVTYVDKTAPPRFFYIDDGSGVTDGQVLGGQLVKGLRVWISNLAPGNVIIPPSVGDYVAVTGICTTYAALGKIFSQVRPRSQADIVVLVSD